ncbi:hypothetical protein SPBR_07983 [Sporothrix brasiliensis 5110]|uniref:Uncharacterized protein n=1 Tax=Sporothrix brasiliensis 5110 TaxID=1398154 RepID=A0A0C2IP63_9PEZI|nr:uncharacterized protein SPBR_07983 [Sporothrix brasiliensis 5110]KIH88710.1 hypothetical protein SPBR_07983 [Sporothrix brasiliensis 5110]
MADDEDDEDGKAYDDAENFDDDGGASSPTKTNFNDNYECPSATTQDAPSPTKTDFEDIDNYECLSATTQDAPSPTKTDFEDIDNYECPSATSVRRQQFSTATPQATTDFDGILRALSAGSGGQKNASIRTWLDLVP